MTKQPDPLRELAANRQIDDGVSVRVTVGELRAALHVTDVAPTDRPTLNEMVATVIAAAVEWVDAHEVLTTGSARTPDADLLERYSEACDDLLAVVSQNRAALHVTDTPAPDLDALAYLAHYASAFPVPPSVEEAGQIVEAWLRTDRGKAYRATLHVTDTHPEDGPFCTVCHAPILDDGPMDFDPARAALHVTATGPTTEQANGNSNWLGALVLHAEAVHGCEHTDQAREDAGLPPRAALHVTDTPAPDLDRLRAIEAAALAFLDDEHVHYDPDPPCGLDRLRAALHVTATPAPDLTLCFEPGCTLPGHVSRVHEADTDAPDTAP